jgi:hypothetical protein
VEGSKRCATKHGSTGGYIKLFSKSIRTFEEKSTFGSNGKKGATTAYENRVYFTIAISCDVDPPKLIKNIMVEWMRAGGLGLYIKAIPAFNTVSPFVIFCLCNTVNRDGGNTLGGSGNGGQRCPSCKVTSFCNAEKSPKPSWP